MPATIMVIVPTRMVPIGFICDIRITPKGMEKAANKIKKQIRCSKNGTEPYYFDLTVARNKVEINRIWFGLCTSGSA